MKTLIMMRGLPGSGKSTKAKKLHQEHGGMIFSSDEFCMVNGVYQWTPDKAPLVNQITVSHTKIAMQVDEIETIIVDNVNIRLLEMYPYLELAIDHGYKIRYEYSDAPWAWDVDECAKRNTHGVSRKTIREMLDHYEDTDAYVTKCKW